MPTMSNPTIIDLDTTGTQTRWTLSSGQDYIFLGSSTVRTHGTNGPGAEEYCLQTSGGRHIAVIGGKWMPQGGSDSTTATIKVTNYTGTLWIDGVHIDHANLGNRDAISAQASVGVGDVVVQNCIVENIKGTEPGVHGDSFQPHGHVSDCKFHNFISKGNYQGIYFLSNMSGFANRSVDSVELNNIWLHANTKDPNNTNTWNWLLYYGTDPRFPVSMTNVYCDHDQSGWTHGNTIFNGNKTVSGSSISWQTGSPAWTGSVTYTPPPNANDICNPANIGLDYHRGYRSGGPIVVTPDPLDALSFNGTNQAVTYDDGAIWDFPTTNWTLGFLMNFTSDTGTSVRSIFSTGTLTTAGVVGFQIYSASHASEPGHVEFSFTPQAGGTTQYCSSNLNVSSTNADVSARLLDGTWRLWTCEWNSGTSTMNLYQTPVGGDRALVGTLTGVTYGATALNPTTNIPTLMTRAPATASNGRWVNGNMAMFFKIHGLLDPTETKNLAAGQHLITELDRGPHILTYFDTATSPIANDGQGGAADATLIGSPTVTTGPTF
jgi:hypothetical protein